MAPLPVISNVYRVAYHWTYLGQVAVNVTHVRDTAGTASTADCLAAVTGANSSDCWKGAIPGARIDQIAITPLDGVSASLFTTIGVSALWQGGTAGDAIPAAAILVKETTVGRGPAYRGRLFLPFTSEAAQADGKLLGTVAPNMQTGWDYFRTHLPTATAHPFEWVVASYKYANAHAVLACQVEGTLGTQRRRQSRLR